LPLAGFFCTAKDKRNPALIRMPYLPHIRRQPNDKAYMQATTSGEFKDIGQFQDRGDAPGANSPLWAAAMDGCAPLGPMAGAVSVPVNGGGSDRDYWQEQTRRETELAVSDRESTYGQPLSARMAQTQQQQQRQHQQQQRRHSLPQAPSVQQPATVYVPPSALAPEPARMIAPAPAPAPVPATPPPAAPAPAPAMAPPAKLSLVQQCTNHIRGTMYDLAHLKQLPVKGGTLARIQYACTRDNRLWTWVGLFFSIGLVICIIVAIVLMARRNGQGGDGHGEFRHSLAGGAMAGRGFDGGFGALDQLMPLPAGALPLIDIRD
jgi:hypothetical protein